MVEVCEATDEVQRVKVALPFVSVWGVKDIIETLTVLEAEVNKADSVPVRVQRGSRSSSSTELDLSGCTFIQRFRKDKFNFKSN